MTTDSPKPRLGDLLVRSLREAVAIRTGQLRPARHHRLTVREAAVSPPPRFRAARIRRLRETLGLSQPVFARALNVSVGTVRGWEQGVRIPDGPSCRLLDVAERFPEAILSAVHSAA